MSEQVTITPELARLAAGIHTCDVEIARLRYKIEEHENSIRIWEERREQAETAWRQHIEAAA